MFANTGEKPVSPLDNGRHSDSLDVMYTLVSLHRPKKEIHSINQRLTRSVGRIDKVAYVRFASVYRSFEDVDEFRQLIRDI